jgi:hypothetical protein
LGQADLEISSFGANPNPEAVYHPGYAGYSDFAREKISKALAEKGDN